MYGNKKCKKQEGLLEEDVKFADIFVAVGLLLSFLAVFAFIFSAQSIGNIVQKTVHDGKPEVSVSVIGNTMNAVQPQLVKGPSGTCPIYSYTFGLAFHYHHSWSAYWGLYSGCDSGTYTLKFSDSIGFSKIFKENIVYYSSESGSIICNNAITANQPTISTSTCSAPGELSIPTQMVRYSYSNLNIAGTNNGEPTVTLHGEVFLLAAPGAPYVWYPSGQTFSGELSMAYMSSGNFQYYCPYPIAPGTTLTGYGS